MISVLFSLLVFAVFVWLLKARRSASLAAVFLLFSLITRVAALLYVDIAGPVYSEQLSSFVGGGPSMPLFAGSVLALLLPLAYFFRPIALARQLRPPRAGTLYNPLMFVDLIFFLLLAFVVAMYADMVIRGPIPLLAGMDRLEYDGEFAGPLHAIVKEHGFMVAFLLGMTLAYPRIHGGDFRIGPLALYVAIMIYYALTGNRFSAFYAFTAFFVIPLAGIMLLRARGMLASPPKKRSSVIRFVVSPAARALALAVGVVTLVLLLLHSVVIVRSHDDPAELFFQRVLVQPVELWWATWTDIQAYGNTSFDNVWNELFVNPLDATRNTSNRFLMLNSLGYERALELAQMGQTYAGGYPEVLFELLGPWRALPAALIFSIVTVLLLRLVVIATCLGRIGTAITGTYVFYGFTLLYIGGMLNFLIVWTYWLKCAALLVVYLIERRHTGRIIQPIHAALPTNLAHA